MPLHILFADDDSDELYLFNEALEHSGLEFTLSHVNDGNSLLAYLRNNPLPDVVVADINMPHKNGLESLTEIRNNSQFSHLPLIIYSNTENSEIIDASFQKGAQMFLVKPDNFDGMVRIVKKICTTDWKNYKTPSRNHFVITTISC